MEFHARVSEIGAFLVPWNCLCQLYWRTPSCMEFYGTARVIEIGAPEVPWNSMELLLSSK